MRKIVVSFSAVLVCAILLVWRLITHENAEVRALGKELGKLTGQVALVAVVGGVVVQEYNRRRERKAALNEFRSTMLRNLIHSYAGAKKSRRLLRARCRIRGEAVDPESREELSRVTYEEQMGALSETQLELEMLVHELNTFRDAFSQRNEIRKHVDKMENYLGTLITEYETSLREIEDGVYISLGRLARLSDFIHGHKDSYFRKNFTRPFHAALTLIQAERLKVS